MSDLLIAHKRPSKQTKGTLRTLRQSGFVPGVIYGEKKESICVSVCLKTLMKEIEKKGVMTRKYNLGEEFGNVMVKAVDFPPTTNIPLHIDFVRLGAFVEIAVPITFINENTCPGLKKGGILNIVHHRVKMIVPSENIPSSIYIDLEKAEMGDSIQLKSVNIDPSYKVLHFGENETLVSIVAPSGLNESLKTQS